MKKAIFYPALVALILANVFVYSCQKENPVTTASAMTELTVVDRAAPCSPICIANGVDLEICNIDVGNGTTCTAPCSPFTTGVPLDVVAADPECFAFLNSNTFSLRNPTGSTITVGVYAGTCAGIVIGIPSGGTRIFKVTFNAGTGCCEVTLGC